MAGKNFKVRFTDKNSALQSADNFLAIEVRTH